MKPNRMILICGKNCMPCRMLENWMQEHNIEIEHVFGEDNLDLCRKYQVMRTPTLVLIEDPVEGVSSSETHETISGFEDIKSYLENR